MVLGLFQTLNPIYHILTCKAKIGSSIRNLFDKVYEKDVNPTLEKPVAWYLDGDNSVHWWHRLVAKQDYHLQGWQRNKVYPDFLVCLQDNPDGSKKFMVLETKGKQLKGNDH